MTGECPGGADVVVREVVGMLVPEDFAEGCLQLSNVLQNDLGPFALVCMGCLRIRPEAEYTSSWH